ncbi:MAG: cobalamin-dependent protein [Spirochaetales bacterium]|nr:cobalamin-dependent protein [Spirochaetales bacterium]
MAGFSTRLRALRAQRAMRQKDLAAKLGLAQTTIANYEQGSRFPDEKTLHRIADQFGVSLDYLLGRSQPNLAAESSDHARGFHLEPGEKPAPLEPLARGYLQALLAGEGEEAERLVLEALEAGRPIEELYLKVFERALKEIGRLWEAGRLDVGAEHYVSASTQAIMARLRPYLMADAPTCTGRTCLVFSVCGEFHEVGSRMVSDFLERAGWRSLFLGGNFCSQDVVGTAERHRADLIAVSATLYVNVDPVARMIRTLRDAGSLPELRILVGGRPFNLDAELWKRVGADGCACNAAAAVGRAAVLVGPGPAPGDARVARSWSSGGCLTN